MSETDMVRAVLVNGAVYERKSDGTLVPFVSRTDYARLDAMSQEEIERIAAEDEDGPPMSDEDWAKAKLLVPRKVAVGMKLDDDVVTWFKSQGRGYQTRINRVLRHYMETQRRVG